MEENVDRDLLSENSDSDINSDDDFYDESDETDSNSDPNDSDILESSPGPSTSTKRQTTPKKQYPSDENSRWSEIEESLLLNAFKDYGTGHLKALCESVPSKNANEIKEYVERKRKVAVNKLREGVNGENEASIDKWIKHLCKLSPNDEYKCQYVARALKYIALFEERSIENENDEGVNLKDCYLILSSLLSGEGPKFTNRVNSYFLHNEIQKFAKTMKEAKHLEELKYLKSSSKPVKKCYGKKKTSLPVEDQVLNPLSLPKDVLKLN